MDFEFRTVPEIAFRPGAAADLGAFVRARFPAEKVLVVTDAGLLQAGVLEAGLASLKAAGLDVEVNDSVVADPPEEIILALGAAAARHGELIIGFGGGSSMDAAKLAAVLADGEQPLQEMYGVDQVTASRRPLLLLPTTAGTGSEATPISIVTTGETTKSGVVSPKLYADCALLDPDLTLGLPAPVTAATGVDAMVHAIEAFTSKHKKNPVSDALAMRALSLLAGAVPAACTDGADRKARADAMLGALLAGQAFANAPVAAVHALAYPLGGVFHLPHGLSNALVLPHVLRFNMSHAEDEYAALAPLVAPRAHTAADFVTAMEGICETVGLLRPLREFEISHNDLPRLAEDAMKQTRLLVNNPREVTYDDALRIYGDAW